MPAELAIILVIVIGGIWLIVKIGQGVVSAIENASKSYETAAVKRKATRYAKRRDALRPYVHFLLPNELDRFEKKLEATQVEFEEIKACTKWVAHPPAWKVVYFQPVDPPAKSNGYGELFVADLDAILSPNPDSSTWLEEESEVISRQCKYLPAPPDGQPEPFAAFSTLSTNLKAAIFQIDVSHIKRRDVERYFADERDKVLTYNNRRADLIAKSMRLNSAIEEWNKKNRISWEEYVVSFERMKAAELLSFQCASDLYTEACMAEGDRFKGLMEGYNRGEKQSVVERLDYVLHRVNLPSSVPHTWDIDFDDEQQIAVVDVGLPDVVHRLTYKTVVLKSGAVKKPLNQTERKEFAPKVHPAILLRIAYEVFRNDAEETIKLLVVNGWVKFDDPATGINTKAYTASLMITRDQIAGLNLTKIDPIAAFNNLHGKSAGKLVEIIPIEPVLSLNRKDSRFVDAKEVLSGLGAETNLAGMDWQDFEHLIRELFEKEFSGRGAEVKITQASRDRGVDAVVFDPDPIHGGKYVIQAKRYTNTVDVSAVRDLCAVVKKEGASRGILVTTSSYGADAYAFANNEPVTLLNGAELLGLLKKHGYAFRINLQEARRSI
jgi:Restriction endonuclease